MIQWVVLLLSATLFGGMALDSFGFAPVVFSSLPAGGAPARPRGHLALLDASTGVILDGRCIPERDAARAAG